MSSWSFYWFVTMRNVLRAIWFLHYFAIIGFWYWCVCACVSERLLENVHQQRQVNEGWCNTLWEYFCTWKRSVKGNMPVSIASGGVFSPQTCQPANKTCIPDKKKELIVVFSTEGSLIKAHIKSIVSPNCHLQMPVLENQLTRNYKPFGIVSKKKTKILIQGWQHKKTY